MRTKKTARNLIISTILTSLVALIGLFKIKVFLAELGDEATGIYQLFTQIFSYISLYVSSVISFSPLSIISLTALTISALEP